MISYELLMIVIRSSTDWSGCACLRQQRVRCAIAEKADQVAAYEAGLPCQGSAGRRSDVRAEDPPEPGSGFGHRRGIREGVTAEHEK